MIHLLKDPSIIAAIINGAFTLLVAYITRRKIKRAEKDIDGVAEVVGTERARARKKN